MIRLCLTAPKSGTTPSSSHLHLDRASVGRIAVDSLGRARSHELHTKEINRNCLADIANEIAIERECQVYVRPFAYEDPTIVCGSACKKDPVMGVIGV